MSTYALDKRAFPLHEKAVQAALGEYAKHVRESPPHSNSGTAVRRYQAATFLGGSYWAWCVAFFDWSWSITGHPLPYRGAGAYDMLNWAGRAGWRTNTPIPGDGVCWNVGSGHWSMFLRFEGGYVVTVDGNVSDAVAICRRPRSLVRGYMHVHETPLVVHKGVVVHKIAPVPKKLTKAPLYEIVTSATGHKQIVAGRPLKELLPFVSKVAKWHPGGITIRKAGK